MGGVPLTSSSENKHQDLMRVYSFECLACRIFNCVLLLVVVHTGAVFLLVLCPWAHVFTGCLSW